MKYSQWIGIAAAALLVASCFMPWAWYPDLNINFTGFYSYQNYYGKPGKLLMGLAVLAAVFYLIPKVWAKRINLLVNAIVVSYTFYCFITFTRCYGPALCPEKRVGLYLLMLAALAMLATALLPDVSASKSSSKEAVSSRG